MPFWPPLAPPYIVPSPYRSSVCGSGRTKSCRLFGVSPFPRYSPRTVSNRSFSLEFAFDILLHPFHMALQNLHQPSKHHSMFNGCSAFLRPFSEVAKSYQRSLAYNRPSNLYPCVILSLPIRHMINGNRSRPFFFPVAFRGASWFL